MQILTSDTKPFVFMLKWDIAEDISADISVVS